MSGTEANRQASSRLESSGRWPAAPLQLHALDAARMRAPLAATTLCRVGYGEVAMPADVRCVRIPLALLQGDHVGEDWDSPLAVHSGREGDIRFAENGELLMASLALPETQPADPEAAAATAYARLLAFIAARGYPQLLRVWNYLERINEGEGDAERYRQFCVGRHQALVDAQMRSTHGDYGNTMQLPAASAIGSQAGGLQVHAFATRHSGLQVENPRQVSAFRYPRSYGARSPSFSRATLAPWADGAQLFVSGTASIIGHATAHAGDVAAQLVQTAANLETLRTHAVDNLLNGIEPAALAPELYTVYLRHAEDLPTVAPVLRQHFADAPCKVLIGDICRRELLVEVEASYRVAGAAPAAGGT